MKKLLFILLSLAFLPVNAQGTYTYTQTYYNVELCTKMITNSDGTHHFVYGLEKFGREIIPMKYQFEYNETLKLFVFYNKKEARVFSAITGNEVRKYIAPRKVSIVAADFKPYSSFTFDIKVKTKRCEKSLGVYTAIKEKVYEIPRESRYTVH